MKCVDIFLTLVFGSIAPQTPKSNIATALTVDLDATIASLKSILESEGKSDVRSPLTRVRRLADLYQAINNIDYANLTFSEILFAAVKRKFGEKLWLEDVTPKTQLDIQKKGYITLRTVARNIVLAGVEKDKTLWDKVDLNVYSTIGSASKVVRDYIVGESWPTERVPDERILFIEEYLGLPKKSLLSKILRKVDHNNESKKTSEKSIALVNARRLSLQILSSDLQRVFDEYSNYKLNGTQPPLKQIPPNIKASRRAKLRSKVQEDSKRNIRWTKNTLGIVGSQQGFKVQLLTFQDFCINNLNIKFEEVSSEHLTTPEIWESIIDFCSTQQTGTTSFVRLFNFVKRGVGPQGYLRFCALIGNRTETEFFDDCDFLREEYKVWVEKASEGIYQKTSEAQKGKTNISFLLNESAGERKKSVTESSKWLVERSNSFVMDANKKRALLSKTVGDIAQLKIKKSAATLIRKAMQYMRTALIQQIAFYNCPRCGNWVALKYYSSETAKDNAYASLTYLRKSNQFKLYIPRFGLNLIDETETARVLKNANAKKVVDVDVVLPASLSPLIKRFLEIRDLYIKYDLMEFGGVNDQSEIELLFPWRSVRQKHTLTDARANLRSAFVDLPSKFSDSFMTITYYAYFHTKQHVKQWGINIHALRHLVAETHLDEHPGDFIGAAAKLNDDVEQIIKTYGDKDRSKAMRRVTQISDDDLVVM